MQFRDDAEPSYDPRSWSRPRPVPTPAPPVATPHVAGRSRSNLPLVGGVAVALGGAFLAFTARPTEENATVPTPAPAAATGETFDQRVLNIATPGAIAPTLRSLGVAPADADRAAGLAQQALGDTPGLLRLDVTLAGAKLHALTATHVDGGGVVIERSGDGTLAARSLSAKLTRRMRFVRGELDGESFYSSAVAAGVSDVLVGAFANAFRYDFDIQREVSQGDVFEAGFEERVNADGEAVGAPRLVYAFLSTPARTRALYQYRLPGDAEAEWFDSSGRSSRRSLMRTPVDAARISSGFGMRGHPILGFRKMHRGTDFAAPTGTPIFAAGDATVSFAGMKGANGNFVRLRHDNGWETLYLHMNRIAAAIVPGSRVAQGTQIGEVGTTGRSTGPHLHYEVHVDGQAVDPMSIETGGGRSIPGAAMTAFRKIRDAIDAKRAATM
ncbi:M23 family metallopeptidase [Sphingomonas sp. 2R-10]|uniref:M23 family metallopeptidase n=1 Tax=Sphingomonas sp. 2R-10 TaxID=3045148 RepID=UPI000F76A796|nr:M23 family metallopeptidase [Sphingomonas sp. 2R-10]MDJ0278263.1 M23 family metallopeptidase [Sphingomonas sp. 2R-10]